MIRSSVRRPHRLCPQLSNRFRDTLTAVLDRHKMLSRGRRVGVAVSGGADSVFLLHILHELGLATAVLHVNHKLRGEDSDSDERFVRRLAEQFGLRVLVCAHPLAEGNVEQEARRVRYDFFSEQIAAGVCDVIATGHNADDQAETVLSRFLRGSGTAGLSGILPVTDAGIIRPLLDFGREEIRTWLRERGISWQEDCSNSNTAFLRNRLRIELMPQLAELNPALVHTLGATSEWARREEAYWNQEIGRLAPVHLMLVKEAVLIELASFCNLPVAVQGRLLRRGIEIVRGSLRGIEFRHLEAILELTRSSEGSGRLQLPDLDIYRSFDWLRFAPVGYDSRLERNFESALTVPGVTAVPERGLTLEMELVTGSHVYNKQVNALDFERCAGPLMLRNWQPGDAYQPFGKSGVSKIKTMFQEHRVPLWERRAWPVVTQGDSILWARRFGAAQDFGVTAETRQVLVIRELGESNSSEPTSIDRVKMQLQRAGAERGAEVS